MNPCVCNKCGSPELRRSGGRLYCSECSTSWSPPEDEKRSFADELNDRHLKPHVTEKGAVSLVFSNPDSNVESRLANVDELDEVQFQPAGSAIYRRNDVEVPCAYKKNGDFAFYDGERWINPEETDEN